MGFKRYTIIETGFAPMISESRMSIYDVLLAQQEGDSLYEICGIYNLWPLQVKVAFEYIEEHREQLEAELPKLLEQKAARERHYRAIAAEHKAFYELREQSRQIWGSMPIKILSDENCIGQVDVILNKVDKLGYVERLNIELLTWDAIDLNKYVDDKQLWRFCQDNHCLLITNNRTGHDGKESLEHMTRHLFNSTSLPVLTIGKLKNALPNSEYSTTCAKRLIDIISELDKYRGVARLYLS